MTEQVYPNVTDLPIIANEGDVAVIEADGSVYHFLNGLGDPNYSWVLSNNASNKITVKENIVNTLDSFHVSFWNFTTLLNGKNYFTINLKNQDSSISDDTQTLILNEQDIVSVKPISPLSENYPSSIRFNGNSIIKSDSAFDNYDSTFKSFTVEGWYKNEKSGFSNIYSTEALTSIGKNFLIDNNNVIVHGRKYSFDSHSDINFKLGNWEHFAYTYDGYDVKNFKDGKQELGVFDNSYEYSHGPLSTSDFHLEDDAGFQAKVFFESTSSNNVLFQIGAGTQKTILHIDAGVLKLDCHGLVASTSSFPSDDDYHVVSWDYKISTKRIRLFIDGDLKASAVGSPWIANYWGNKEVDGIADFGYVETASVVMQDVVQGYETSYYTNRGAYYTAPMNMTVVEDGNILVTDKINYGPAFFSIGPSGTSVGNRHVMDPTSNNIYYFEMYFDGVGGNAGWYDQTALSFRLMHSGWDGTNPALYDRDYYWYQPHRSHIYEYWANQYYNGSLRYRYRPEYDNATTGYFVGGTQSAISTVNGANIFSVFIDFANDRIIILKNKTHFGTFKANLNLLNYTPDGGGLILAVQEHTRFTSRYLRWYYTYGQPINGQYPPLGPYDTRSPQPYSKMVFNSKDWFYNPAELHNQYVLDRAAGVNSGGRFEWPYSQTGLTTIASPHMYARSDNHIDWMKEASAPAGSDSAYPNDLRYFPQCFEEMGGKILSVGADRVNHNEENETGLSYAQAYVASTGGTLRTVNAAVLSGFFDDLRNYIDNPIVLDGDAIYLEPGTYECSLPTEISRGVHHLKNVLICGSDTRQVTINYNSNINRYYGNIFSSSNNQAQLAFLTLNRTSNIIYDGYYTNCIFYKGTGGKAYKVVFDFNNRSFSLYNDAEGRKNGSLIIEKCHFKNYSKHTALTYGYPPKLKLKNNTFEKQFKNVGIDADTSHVEIGINKSYMTNYDTTSEYIYGTFINGHMKNFMIQSGVQRNTNFTPPTDPTYYDNISNDILIRSEIGYRNLLRLGNDGIIYKKEKKIGSIDSSRKSTWVFNELNYDGNNFTISKNSTIAYTFNDLFDSHSIDSCEINWATHDSFDVSQDKYISIAPDNGDLIHEILIDNNVRTSIAPPSETQIADSIDPHFSISAVGFGVASDTTVDVLGSFVSAQSGPYAAGSRSWYKLGVITPGYDSISRNFLYDLNGNVFDSALIASYPDSIIQSDLVGNPLDLTIDFIMRDDIGNSIKWNVDNFQVDRRIRVGYDSLNGGKFIIRQYNDSSFDKDRLASVTFTPELINKVSDSLPLFRLDADGLYLTPAVSSHTLTYHYLATDPGPQSSPFHLQRMRVDLADSTISDSDYIFIGDSGTNTDLLYNSLGELPL